MERVSRRRFIRNASLVTAAAALAGVPGIKQSLALTSSTPTTPSFLGVPQIPASFIIHHDGIDVVSQNSLTGQVDFRDPDAASVIQKTVNALRGRGGKIFIRAGTYEITSTIDLDDYVELEGENIGYVYPAGGTVLKAQGNVNVISLIGTEAQHKLMPSIKSIYFDGGGNSCDAIHFEHVSVAMLRDVFIINFNGSAIYLDSIFTGIFSNIKIDSCGSLTKPAWVMTGVEACSSIMIEQVDNSLFRNTGLLIDTNCAEITISDYFGDGLDTNTASAIDIQGNRVSLSNVHCRGIDVGFHMLKVSGDHIQFSNLHVEGRGGLLLTEPSAGNVLIGAAHFAGQSAANPAQVAIDCQGGNVSIGVVQFENVIAKSSLANGIIGSWDPTQSAGIETASYSLVEFANTSGPVNLPNTGALMPVFVPRVVTVETFKIRVANQIGNIDVGIYDGAGNKLVSTGSIPTPPTGFAFVNIPRTALFPGLHYFALASDNTTAAFYKTAPITPGSKKAFRADSLFPLPLAMPSISESGDGRFWMEAV